MKADAKIRPFRLLNIEIGSMLKSDSVDFLFSDELGFESFSLIFVSIATERMNIESPIQPD